VSKNEKVLTPDDHSGIIAGFHATIRFLKRATWVGLFVALVLILTLTARSAQ
jgi:hypothetical protein